MGTIQAVIFDCDGTLVDSESVVCDVMCSFVAEFGLALTPREYLDEFAGVQMAATVAEFERRLGRRLPSTFVPQLRARMAEAFTEHLQPMPGAVETVRALTIPFCVASGGPRAKIELSLTIVGLLDAFEGRIFSSYDVNAHKPDPGLFLHAAAALGVPPARCAVIEDSPTGFAAARAAGTQLFVLDPDRRYRHLVGDATVLDATVLDEISEILAYLD